MTLRELFIEIGADIDIVINRFAGNEKLLERFIKKFPEDKNFEELKKAVQDDDYQVMERTAHTLKGVSANLGFSEIGDICADIVQAVRQEKQDTISLLFEELKVKYETIVNCIIQLQ